MIFRNLVAIFSIAITTAIPLSILAAPEISVDPLVIESEINYGDSQNLTINISNTGDEDLIFTVQSEPIAEPDQDTGDRTIRQTFRNYKSGPRRDEFGDVIAEYNVGQGPWSGLAWDGEFMCGIRYDSRTMIIFDPGIMEVIEEIEIPIYDQGYGLVCQGSLFWASVVSRRNSNDIMRFDREGSRPGRIRIERAPVHGIAFDGRHIYYHADDQDGNRTVITQITMKGEFVRDIDCSEIFEGGDLTLEWVELHDRGRLWAIEWSNGNLSQIDISGEEPELIQRTQIVRNQSHGMAHDGENLWYSTMQGDWVVIDDGIREIEWLRFTVGDDILERGDETEVTLTINAEELIAGEYEAGILITSNDPDRPTVVVSVSATVIAIPVLDLTWSEELGYPEFIDWREEYSDLFTGQRYPVQLIIHNRGTADLEIESITCENVAFISQPDNLVCNPGEFQIIEFLFCPDEIGDYVETMVIEWNSPEGENTEIEMRGYAANPPVIEVDINGIDHECEIGELEEFILQITNRGESLLRFNVDPDFISEPERISELSESGGISNQKSGPCRDDAGDIIAEYELIVENARWYGLAHDGELVWINNRETCQIFGFNPISGEIVDTLNFDEQFRGLTHDGQSFWAGRTSEMGGEIIRFDRDGEIIQSIECPDLYVIGVTFDGENLWICPGNVRNHNITLRKISTDGEMLSVIDVTDLFNGSIPDIAFIPEHNQGNLWIVNYSQLHQIDIEDDNVEIIQQIDLPNSWRCIDHDGTDLWSIKREDGVVSLIRVDDGIVEHPWICVEPVVGEVDPGSELGVSINLGDGDLIEGEYEADLHIRSNDPFDPDFVVSVVLNVNGNPDIDVYWLEEFGYPDVIDWNLAYDVLFTGVEYPIAVNISNTGTANMLVEEISPSDRGYRADQEDFILAPLETRSVNFSLNVDEPGDCLSEMLIFSNDRDEGELIIPLCANISSPPRMGVSRDNIESELISGETDEQSVRITNDGQSVLCFSVSHEYIFEQEENLHQRCNPRSNTERNSCPQRDEFGDVIAEYELGQSNISGISFDGELIWCLNFSQSTLFSFNPEIEEITDIVRLDGACRGLDCDGEFFWTGDGGEDRLSRIFRIDGNGRIMQVIWIDDYPVGGITHHGDTLFITFGSSLWGGVPRIKQLTTGGELIREIDCANLLVADGFRIEWVEAHRDGHIWALDYNRSSLLQLDISEDFARLIKETEAGPESGFGITHDGENIWYSHESTLKVIDDGIKEENWISYEPVSGEIEPGGNSDINLTTDATDLEQGDYRAELHIDSNDPENLDTVVNVLLHIEPNSVETEENIPLTYNLSPAYPNPFNSSTIIKYTVPIITDVKIKVYDIAGHLVQTLLNERKSAGVYSVIWNGENLANGLYLVLIESGDYQSIRKVTLLK